MAKNYIFTYKINLDDLDYMGIVGNSEWMVFLERARISLLEEIGFPFSEMMKQKIGGVVAEANIKYLKPAFFGDQLNINIIPHNQFSKGFVLKYLVINQKKIECLAAEVTIIFVDEHGKSTFIPEQIKNILF